MLLTFRRKQLDAALNENTRLKELTPPQRGWIHEIRTALGMNKSQLAQRLGTSKQAVAALELRELEDKVTVETLKKAAEAMDCRLVIAIVPKESLHHTVTAQAEIKAREPRASLYWLTAGKAHLWDQ